jgi:tetratricopeptide (TPR) repeat protein
LLQSRIGHFFYKSIILLAVLRGAGPSSAWAQAAPSPDIPATLERARHAEDAGRLKEAVEALEEAYEAGGDPELLFRLAELNSKLGQIVPALRLYRTYVSRDSSGKYRAAAEQQIRALQEREQSLEHEKSPSPPLPVPATGVASPVAGAAGTSAITAPGPVTRAPAPVDGAGQLSTAAPAVRLDTSPPPREPEPPLPRWLPWAGLAATVGLAVAAMVSEVSASSQYSTLLGSCGATDLGCTDTQINDLRSRARTTTILWIGAGVLAAATGTGVYVNTQGAGFSGIWRF